MNSAEMNYPIHDKELLAIVKALQEWTPELKGQPFEVRTDHKAREYFLTSKKLSERQIRWYEFLSEFPSMTIKWQPGKDNAMADALSRREQDLPKPDDPRFQDRIQQIFHRDPDGHLRLHAAPVPTCPDILRVPEDLQPLWNTAVSKDSDWRRIRQAVQAHERRMPDNLDRTLKVAITDCSIQDEHLIWRARLWVPDHEPLRTAILQRLHDGLELLHPGKTQMVASFSRSWFWPGYARDIQRFVRNCHTCNSTSILRERKQGLLHPLPIPDRPWREIGMDFIGPFQVSPRKKQWVLVIIDRLSKGTILIPCTSHEPAYIVDQFLRYYYPRHGIPEGITSDREFVNQFWKRLTSILGINHRRSTAYHPETDGATERQNQEVKQLLRKLAHTGYSWDQKLPLVEFALHNRTATSTGVSPFFFSHGYNFEPLPTHDNLRHTDTSPPAQAEAVVKRIQDINSWAQANLAVQQQSQESYANVHHNPHPLYRVGDRVWLALRDDPTARHAKFTVTEVVSPLNYRLDIPGRAHKVFHADRLRPAASDAFPSQVTHDEQPDPILIDGEPEFEIEAILRREQRLLNRRLTDGFIVKWTGYPEPTWKPASAMQDTAALDRFEANLSMPGG